MGTHAEAAPVPVSHRTVGEYEHHMDLNRDREHAIPVPFPTPATTKIGRTDMACLSQLLTTRERPSLNSNEPVAQFS